MPLSEIDLLTLVLNALKELLPKLCAVEVRLENFFYIEEAIVFTNCLFVNTSPLIFLDLI